MKFLSKKALTLITDYLVITLGVLTYVSAWAVFLMPNNLLGGGVSGLCAIIYYATGISMGISNLVINAVLLILGTWVLGHGFGIKTIYAIIAASLGLTFLPGMIPTEFVEGFVLENGKMLCTIIGGLMTGLGIGLTFTHGGSTGGTDIIALMINKYRNISPGRLLLLLDAFIISISLLVPSYQTDGSLLPFSQKFANVIYAFILVSVNSYTVDLYLTGTKQSVQMFIFSKKPEVVADAIAYDMHRGVTMLRARGWHLKQDNEVITVVARRTDINPILRCIKEIDPDAFVSIANVMGVYGLGFDTFKDKKSKKA